jgi:hypothetical protein
MERNLRARMCAKQTQLLQGPTSNGVERTPHTISDMPPVSTSQSQLSLEVDALVNSWVTSALTVNYSTVFWNGTFTRTSVSVKKAPRTSRPYT